MKKILSALLFILPLTACLAYPTIPSPTPIPSRTTTSQPVTSPTPASDLKPVNQTINGNIERDITYCTNQGVALKLDLYLPDQSNNKLVPVAVNIHGGSWSVGDKGKSDSAADISTLVERGYAVAALNYRLAPEYKFPAQIEDVKCAIRFLRANSTKYNIDPNRIGAWGCSAGGHLAALLGLADSSAGFDRGEYSDQSSQVQVVATLSAPMDITLYDRVGRKEMLEKVFGTTMDKTVLENASPVSYVSKNAPPFLIFQGKQDSLIPAKNGEELIDRLTAVGVSGKLITVQNGTHCFPPTPSMDPPRTQISSLIADYFDRFMHR